MIGAREACVTLAIVLIVAYVLGSFPTSYIVVHRITGGDIRQLGSGNPGTMNVLDSVGGRAAMLVGGTDIAKGTAAVGLAYLAGVGDIGAVAAGLAAVAGHDFSLFLRFHGGNGTAPATGALYALAPLAGLFATSGAMGIYLLLRSRRPAGMAGLLMLPPLAYAFDEPTVRVAGTALLVVVTAVKIGLDEGFSFARPPHGTHTP